MFCPWAESTDRHLYLLYLTDMSESVGNPSSISLKLSLSLLCKRESRTLFVLTEVINNGLEKFLYSEHRSVNSSAHLLQTTSWGPRWPSAIIYFLTEIASFSLCLCNQLSAKKWKEKRWLICGLMATHPHPISFIRLGGVWLDKNPQKWLITPTLSILFVFISHL